MLYFSTQLCFFDLSNIINLVSKSAPFYGSSIHSGVTKSTVTHSLIAPQLSSRLIINIHPPEQISRNAPFTTSTASCFISPRKSLLTTPSPSNLSRRSLVSMGHSLCRRSFRCLVNHFNPLCETSSS